ncbi:TPA: ATP-binding cassette domain-containing protein, partial [Escherichia coli]|nr:ATP-binding cassette domain-containing protein [Escherichia coli]
FMRESMKDSSQRQGLIVEALDGIETLKLNNAINWAQERWDRFTAGVAASAIKLKNTSNVIMYVTAAIQQLNTVLLVFVGTYLIHSENPYDKITMGALIASVILSGRALAPLGMLASLATRYQQAKLALKGVEEIAQKKTESDSERNYVTLKNIQGEIIIKNVSFSYNKEQLGIMSDVSVSIRPGEKVGIVGKIGGGKSTLLKLMVGLYQPLQGNITLDSIDIRQLDPFFIRDKIYLLEQYPHLFLGTLRENLMLSHFDNYLSDVEMINAAARFGFDSVIKNHPRGLDMLVGEGGAGLSGGQRQIIALIRMILRSPKVVLLDEPTTGLDQASEIIALNAINNWARDKTMIVVTHRPQVLNIVDRLIVIDEGK